MRFHSCLLYQLPSRCALDSIHLWRWFGSGLNEIVLIFVIHARLRLPWDLIGLACGACFVVTFSSALVTMLGKRFFSGGREALYCTLNHHYIAIVLLCYLFRRINAVRGATRSTKASEQPSNIVLVSWYRFSIIPHSHCTSKQGRAEPSYASWAKCHLNRTVPEVVHLWLGYRGGVVQFGCIKVQLAFILWEIYNRASVARFGFNVQCERSIRKSISTYQDDVRRLFWGFCWSCSTTHSIYTSKQVAQQNNRDIMVV